MKKRLLTICIGLAGGIVATGGLLFAMNMHGLRNGSLAEERCESIDEDSHAELAEVERDGYGYACVAKDGRRERMIFYFNTGR